MSDLIDRQETIKQFCKQDCDCDPKDCPDKTCYEVEIIESVPTHTTPSNTLGALDLISRQNTADVMERWLYDGEDKRTVKEVVYELPSAQPTQLTDEDKETIRIHLSAFKEKLCNQHRWNEAKEYEELISRLLSTASVQPQKGKWLKAGTRMGIPLFECSLCECGDEVPTVMGKPSYNFCPYCGCRMEKGDSDD